MENPRRIDEKIDEKSTKIRWKIDVKKNLFFQSVFASIFLDFRPQNPSIFACILEFIIKQVPKMQNLKIMHFLEVKLKSLF